MLAAGGTDGVPKLWNLKTCLSEALPKQMAAVTAWPGCPTATPAGRVRRAAAAGENGELKVFHFDRQPPPSLHRWTPRPVVAGGRRRRPDHRLGGGSRGVMAWDVTKPSRDCSQTSTSLAVALSPDGKLLAAAADRSVRLFDVPRARSGHARRPQGLVGRSVHAGRPHAGDRGRDQWCAVVAGRRPASAAAHLRVAGRRRVAVAFSADGLLAPRRRPRRGLVWT